MDDAEPDPGQLRASYCRMCAEAGVEPLPPGSAREQAKAMIGVLVPGVGIEPTTYRLQGGCSTSELTRRLIADLA